MQRACVKIGVGGPVGSGKTALLNTLCKRLRGRYSIAVIVKHLRVVEELFLAQLEQGEQSPYTNVPSVLKLTGSVPLNFDQNLKEFEELHARFVTALKHMTLADLKRKTFVSPFAQGARPANGLLFSEIGHLTLHRGQIRTLRNLYRRTRGEAGLFAPKNPTFDA